MHSYTETGEMYNKSEVPEHLAEVWNFDRGGKYVAQ